MKSSAPLDFARPCSSHVTRILQLQNGENVRIISSAKGSRAERCLSTLFEQSRLSCRARSPSLPPPFSTSHMQIKRSSSFRFSSFSSLIFKRIDEGVSWEKEHQYIWLPWEEGTVPFEARTASVAPALPHSALRTRLSQGRGKWTEARVMTRSAEKGKKTISKPQLNMNAFCLWYR